jgi:hypothetical protein
MEQAFDHIQSSALDGALAFSGSAAASGGKIGPALSAGIGAVAGNLVWEYGLAGSIDLNDGQGMLAAAGAFLAGAASGSLVSGAVAAASVFGGRMLLESIGSPLPEGVVTADMNLVALGGGWWILYGAEISQLDTEDTSGFLTPPTSNGAALARIKAAGVSAGTFMFDGSTPDRSTVYMKSWTPSMGYGAFVPNAKTSVIFKA